MKKGFLLIVSCCIVREAVILLVSEDGDDAIVAVAVYVLIVCILVCPHSDYCIAIGLAVAGACYRSSLLPLSLFFVIVVIILAPARDITVTIVCRRAKSQSTIMHCGRESVCSCSPELRVPAPR
jgi:hypothetical protein